MTDNVDDFLAHYGVPGMKWGRRSIASAKSSKSQKPNRFQKRKSDIKKSLLKTALIGGAVMTPVMIVASIVAKKNTTLSDIPTDALSRGKNKLNDAFWDIVNNG